MVELGVARTAASRALATTPAALTKSGLFSCIADRDGVGVVFVELGPLLRFCLI